MIVLDTDGDAVWIGDLPKAGMGIGNDGSSQELFLESATEPVLTRARPGVSSFGLSPGGPSLGMRTGLSSRGLTGGRNAVGLRSTSGGGKIRSGGS